MQEQKLTGYPSIDKPWLKYYSEEAINTSVPECTIYEYIQKKNSNNLDKPAINYYGARFTYKQLFQFIDDTAKALSAIGVKSGDIVSFCMLTMPETIFGFYACIRIGAVSNMIEPRTNAESIKDRINAANSSVLIVVDVFLSKILSIADDTNLKKIVVVPISYSMPVRTKVLFKIAKGRKLPRIPNDSRFIKWCNFVDNGTACEYNPVSFQKNTPTAIIYTGGTTGISKGAVLSNECFTAMAIQAYYDAPTLFTGKRFLEIMPPFIAYGLIFGHFIPFCAGLENCLIPVFDPKKFADYVLKYKPNHVVGVPAFFESLANSKKIKNKDIGYLISAITGGDKMLVGTETHINQVYSEHGCQYPIMKGYGMTEMGSAATFTATTECNLPGSVGIPCHYTTIKVINPDTGEELHYNEQGELCMTGATMMLEYFNNPEETNRIMKKHPDGKMWIHTGDLGYITEDGIVYIVDRLKRMIIRPDGHNVWPALMETSLSKHPNVLDCAVVGLKNTENKNGQIPTAFIVLKDKAPDESLISELDRFCKESLPERDCPMDYRFVDKLPMTLIGKIDYRALEKQAEEMSKE